MAINNLFSEKFTTHLKQVLINATQKSIKPTTSGANHNLHSTNTSNDSNLIQQPILQIVHILDALLEQTGSIAAEVVKKSQIQQNSQKLVRIDSEKTINSNIINRPNITPLTHEHVAQILVKAVQISHKHGHRYIGTEHLLKSLVTHGAIEVATWMKQHNVSISDLEKNIQIVLESTSKFPDLTAVFRENETETKSTNKQTSLEYFGQDLTSNEAQKNIDPVIGREIEIERLISILCRRYKNNPLLLGEAGVGKTAIVEGLAKRINLGTVPPILANKKIVNLDLGAMVAGTMYRGEFEARLKQALESAEKERNVILFIDEMHTIIGAGSASGSLDAANMLKPSLARGNISIIGATTLEEYKKHIETDSALERRLQPVIVSEPNNEETKAVLDGIKENYESFHNVIITKESINAAVEMSNRYMPEKLQPDKSIDLIDEAAARVKVDRSNSDIWRNLRDTEAKIKDTLTQKQQAVANEDYKTAITLKNTENELHKQYQVLQDQTKSYDSTRITVTREHIVSVISALTKIPLGKLETNERTKLTQLENELKQTIVGQDNAIEKIANLIRRARTNVADPNRPIASFIFMGPSGVGKTETAKQLSKTYFGEASNMVTVDMSELSESYSISKLVGSPAGYVGYRDTNSFTDKVRQNPYTVVLLDEIEKAHPEVFNLLLQILETGQITDATGRMVNFRNTILCMTSNIGLEAFNQASNLGFGSSEAENNISSTEQDVLTELKTRFRPEFLNRIDNTIVFRPLNEQAYIDIIKQYITTLNNRLKQDDIFISMSHTAQKHLLKQGHSTQSGARGVRKFFQDNIESEIAKILLAHETSQKQTIKIDVSKNKFTFALDS